MIWGGGGNAKTLNRGWVGMVPLTGQDVNTRQQRIRAKGREIGGEVDNEVISTTSR